jgi:hypothetical protein
MPAWPTLRGSITRDESLMPAEKGSRANRFFLLMDKSGS